MGAGSPLFMHLKREGSAAAFSASKEPTPDVVTAHTLATDDMLAHLRPCRGTPLAWMVAHGGHLRDSLHLVLLCMAKGLWCPPAGSWDATQVF